METFSVMRSKSEREQKREDGSPQGIPGRPPSTPALYLPEAALVSGPQATVTDHPHPLLSVFSS